MGRFHVNQVGDGHTKLNLVEIKIIWRTRTHTAQLYITVHSDIEIQHHFLNFMSIQTSFWNTKSFADG